MRGEDVARMLAGSITVYVIMAACSAGGGPQSFSGNDGGGSGSGASSGASGGGSGGIVDALTDPVTEASADPYQSGSRLKANYYAGSDGSKQWIGWHDSQRNEDCGFTKAADGATRCMPAGVAIVAYYADAACTQPLAYVSCYQGTPPRYVGAQYLGVPGAPSSDGYHLFPLGSTATVTTAYQLVPSTGSDGGACNVGQFTYTCTQQPATTVSYLQSEGTFYSVGAEIPPSAFVQATVQTEP
jgi:hypothetical protein